MLTIDSQNSPSHRTISARGELDLETAPELLNAIRAAIRDAPGVHVDLSGVEYVDSSGIAVLIQGYKLARNQSITYRLRDPSPQVMAVIELSQLEDFFEFERTDGGSS